MKLTADDMSHLTMDEILMMIPSSEVYTLARTDEDFALTLSQYSYEVCRSGVGLRRPEIVPSAGNREEWSAEFFSAEDVIVAGGFAVGDADQDIRTRGLELYGTRGPVDPYLFLAALASGGISGDRSAISGYEPGEFIIIPVLEKTEELYPFRARDIVMTVDMACDLARFLEEDLGIVA